MSEKMILTALSPAEASLYCGEAFVLRLGRKKKGARGDGDTQREPLRRREF